MSQKQNSDLDWQPCSLKHAPKQNWSAQIWMCIYIQCLPYATHCALLYLILTETLEIGILSLYRWGNWGLISSQGREHAVVLVLEPIRPSKHSYSLESKLQITGHVLGRHPWLCSMEWRGGWLLDLATRAVLQTLFPGLMSSLHETGPVRGDPEKGACQLFFAQFLGPSSYPFCSPLSSWNHLKASWSQEKAIWRSSSGIYSIPQTPSEMLRGYARMRDTITNREGSSAFGNSGFGKKKEGIVFSEYSFWCLYFILELKIGCGMTPWKTI